MKKLKRVGIIGFGNMGSACAEAIAFSRDIEVLVYDKKCIRIKKNVRLKKTKTAAELILKSQVVILAIKPQDLNQFLKDNCEVILKSQPLLISILAGVPLKRIESSLSGIKVIRVMTNLAVKVKEALTFMAPGKLIDKADLKKADYIFSLMGKVTECREVSLDKLTALSGSGPGFVYYFMDSFYKEAMKIGFKNSEAKEITVKIFQGAAKLALESGQDFSQLLRLVASPQGTTEAGVSFFDKNKVSKHISEGIAAAYQRAKSISSAVNRRKE